MAYELRIERDPPIEEEEWQSAVRSHPWLRCGRADSVTANPVTGERIAVPGSKSDAQIEVAGTWLTVFHWRHGRVTFNARTVDVTDASDRGARAAFELANALGAVIRGDEGEIYDRPLGID